MLLTTRDSCHQAHTQVSARTPAHPQRIADPESLNAPINDVDAAEDSTATANTADIEWKVLVLDNQARSVISAVLRMNDLRAAGVRIDPPEYGYRALRTDRSRYTSIWHPNGAPYPTHQAYT
jgi:hypothetical protein